MSAVTHPTQPHAGNGYRENGARAWEDRTRIFLSPIAAPSILGLFGFASATFMVAAFLAGWYGQSAGPMKILPILAPFCLAFGGIGQFAAALFSYRARDGIGTAMHGTWGTFWIGFGILWLLVGAHVIALHPTAGGTQHVPYGYWFYTLGAITTCGFIAAIWKNAGLASVLLTLAAGSWCLGIGLTSGIHTWITVGGYVLVVSAALAVYTATALMLTESAGKVILPLGMFPYNKREHWAPGTVLTHPLQREDGMPGVKVGQ